MFSSVERVHGLCVVALIYEIENPLFALLDNSHFLRQACLVNFGFS